MRLIDADYLTTEIARLVVGGKHAIEEAGHGNFWINGLYDVDEVKPYLRPMSSMTEEEKEEYKKLQHCLNDTMLTISLLNNWLNEHHFDYRGLIKKGLAIEVTKENNTYKD